jgi:cytochrome c-type biogenesis protein
MGEWFQSTAASGSLVLAIPVAAVAGLVSFFSPCVIPLLPGYLSYATGLSGAELADASVTRARRWRMLAGACLFVVGFGAVFVILGTASGALGEWLIVYRRQLSVVLGIVSILLGVAFLGLVPALQREWRFHAVPAVGLAAAPLLGFLFGIGWTPCMGPTLAVINNLAFNEASATRGAVLSACYALGLGIPFVVAGVAYERMLGAIRFVRRHQAWVTRTGGALMILVGVLLLTGWWDSAVSWLQLRLVDGYEVSV